MRMLGTSNSATLYHPILNASTLTLHSAASAAASNNVKNPSNAELKKCRSSVFVVKEQEFTRGLVLSRCLEEQYSPNEVGIFKDIP